MEIHTSIYGQLHAYLLFQMMVLWYVKTDALKFNCEFFFVMFIVFIYLIWVSQKKLSANWIFFITYLLYKIKKFFNLFVFKWYRDSPNLKNVSHNLTSNWNQVSIYVNSNVNGNWNFTIHQLSFWIFSICITLNEWCLSGLNWNLNYKTSGSYSWIVVSLSRFDDIDSNLECVHSWCFFQTTFH